VETLVSESRAVPAILRFAPRRSDELRKPLQKWDVYVDDLLGVVQGNLHRRLRVKRTLLHALDRVFRGLDDQDRSS
jgi:hypothetical protein